MKLLAVCLAVSVTSTFAVDPASFENRSSSGSGYTPGDAKVTIFSQTYLCEDIASAWRHYAICDDFIVSSDPWLQSVRFWIIYTGTSAPTDYKLTIAWDANGDSDPNNAAIIYTETCPAVITDTGDVAFSVELPVYEVKCTFDTAARLTGGERYFLEITCHNDIVYDYIVVADYDVPPYGFGTLTWSYSGSVWIRGDDPLTFGDRRSVFFDLFAHLSLQNETWGSIKAIF